MFSLRIIRTCIELVIDRINFGDISVCCCDFREMRYTEIKISAKIKIFLNANGKITVVNDTFIVTALVDNSYKNRGGGSKRKEDEKVPEPQIHAPRHLDRLHWWIIDQDDIKSVREPEWMTDVALFRLLFEKVSSNNRKLGSDKTSLLHISYFNDWKAQKENCAPENYACFLNEATNNRIIIPLLHGGHYFLVEASKTEEGTKHIHIYDSLFGKLKTKLKSEDVRRMVCSIDESFSGCRPAWAEHGNIRLQTDGNSCGIHVLLNTEALMETPPLPHTKLTSFYSKQRSILEERKRLANELSEIDSKPFFRQFSKRFKKLVGNDNKPLERSQKMNTSKSRNQETLGDINIPLFESDIHNETREKDVQIDKTLTTNDEKWLNQYSQQLNLVNQGLFENRNSTCVISMMLYTNYETIPWTSKNTPSKDCMGEMESLGSLPRVQDCDLYGARNAADLILCRTFGLFNINWCDPTEKKFWDGFHICKEHLDELLLSYFSKKSKFYHRHVSVRSVGRKQEIVCSWPKNAPDSHSKTCIWQHQLTKYESKIVMEAMGVRIPVGSHVCQRHHKMITKLYQIEAIPVEELPENFSDHSITNDSDPIFESWCTKTDEEEGEKSFSDSIREAAKQIGVERLITKRDFENWSERTKRDKVCMAKKLFGKVLTLMAPGHETELEKLVHSEQQESFWGVKQGSSMYKLMNHLVAQYFSAGTKSNRRHVLSLMANSLSFAEIHQFIPGLTYHHYRMAKILARKCCQNLVMEKKLERYDQAQLTDFIYFISSPAIMISMPYGTLNTKLSDSTSVKIPQTIRQNSAIEIIEMYKKKLQDEGSKSKMLSDSTLFRILNICAATPRKSHQCVDYFVADGDEGFENLEKMISLWLSENYIDGDYYKQLMLSLKESRQYIHTDYRLHTKPISRIGDHCNYFSLSDPEDVNLANDCSIGSTSHQHDMICERCERGKLFLNEIFDFASERLDEYRLPTNPPRDLNNIEVRNKIEQWEKFVADANRSIRQIQDMKMHFHRASFAANERAEIINTLSPGQGLITMDFSQKFLPRWHRERQKDYYGKKGISFHISHVTACIGQKLIQHSFIQIFDDTKQDTFTITGMLERVLNDLKLMNIHEVILRSDNAGYYHCAPTVVSLFHLSQLTGVFISRYSFSEAQSGKSSSDRMARIVKHHCSRFVDQGGDIRNAGEMFKALTTGRLIDGASVYHVSFDCIKKSNAIVKEITKYNEFYYYQDGFIRMFRHSKIGEGIILDAKQFNSNEVKVSYIGSGGHLATNVQNVEDELEKAENNRKTSFWYAGNPMNDNSKTDEYVAENDKNQEETQNEEDETEITPPEIGKLFSCSEVGCVAEFLTLTGLENHLLRGKHQVKPERMTIKDRSLNMFLRVLEEVDRDTSVTHSDNQSNSKDISLGSVETSVRKGWALRTKQKIKHFTENQKKFVHENYQEAKRKGIRPDGHAAAEKMRQTRKDDGSLLFNSDEFLDWRQLWNAFTRIYRKETEGTKTDNVDAVGTEIDPESLKEMIFPDSYSELAETVELNLDKVFKRK